MTILAWSRYSFRFAHATLKLARLHAYSLHSICTLKVVRRPYLLHTPFNIKHSHDSTNKLCLLSKLFPLRTISLSFIIFEFSRLVSLNRVDFQKTDFKLVERLHTIAINQMEPDYLILCRRLKIETFAELLGNNDDLGSVTGDWPAETQQVRVRFHTRWLNYQYN